MPPPPPRAKRTGTDSSHLLDNQQQFDQFQNQQLRDLEAIAPPGNRVVEVEDIEDVEEDQQQPNVPDIDMPHTASIPMDGGGPATFGSIYVGAPISGDNITTTTETDQDVG